MTGVGKPKASVVPNRSRERQNEFRSYSSGYETRVANLTPSKLLFP
jgi:hypothetical protein